MVGREHKGGAWIRWVRVRVTAAAAAAPQRARAAALRLRLIKQLTISDGSSYM